MHQINDTVVLELKVDFYLLFLKKDSLSSLELGTVQPHGLNFRNFRPFPYGETMPDLKGPALVIVRHSLSIGKGHGLLVQAWSLLHYPVFHGYLSIHCLGSHHDLCLSGIVCAHIFCNS